MATEKCIFWIYKWNTLLFQNLLIVCGDVSGDIIIYCLSFGLKIACDMVPLPHTQCHATFMRKWVPDMVQSKTFISSHVWVIFAVRCRNNAVNFPTNIHKRHPTACLLGWGMGCNLWVQALIDSLPECMQLFMQYLTILDCVIMVLNCILSHVVQCLAIWLVMEILRHTTYLWDVFSVK